FLDSQIASTPVRPPEFCSFGGAIRHAQHSPPPTGAASVPEAVATIAAASGADSVPGPSLVGVAPRVLRRSVPIPANVVPDHRCQSAGVGGVLRRAFVLRPLEGGLAGSAYQPPRAPDRLQDAAASRTVLTRATPHGSIRQFNGGSTGQPSGDASFALSA